MTHDTNPTNTHRHSLNGGESGQWQKLLVTDPPAKVPPPTRYCMAVCIPDIVDEAVALCDLLDSPDYWYEQEGV